MLQQVFEVSLLALTQAQSFLYCPVDNTLFKVGQENRCSDVSSRYRGY